MVRVVAVAFAAELELRSVMTEALTLIVAVPGLEVSTPPSVVVKVNESRPVKPLGGAYVTVAESWFGLPAVQLFDGLERLETVPPCAEVAAGVKVSSQVSGSVPT